MTERKRRTYMHKGKLRFKHRYPRKYKKQYKIELEKSTKKFFEDNEVHLRPFYGDNWMEHIIFGG